MITQVGGHQVAAGNGKYKGYIVNWDVVKPHAKGVSGAFPDFRKITGPKHFSCWPPDGADVTGCSFQSSGVYPAEGPLFTAIDHPVCKIVKIRYTASINLSD